MPITSMSDRLVTVWRRTSNLLDTTNVGVSHSADRQPTKAAYLEVEVTGGTGSIDISGTVEGGGSDVETLAFAGHVVRATVQRFTAIDAGGIVPTGFAGESLTVRGVGANGERIPQSYQVVTGWPMRFNRGRGEWHPMTQGVSRTERTRFFFDYTTAWTPREGDAIVDDATGEEWLVMARPTLHGSRRVAHHYELEVRLRDQSKYS
jgi:hypothetical protein